MTSQTVPREGDGVHASRPTSIVLACGAVENARLLLLSNAGNESRPGRQANFMCHPLSIGQVIVQARGYLTPAQSRLMGGQGMAGARVVDWMDASTVGVTGRFEPNAEQQEKLGIGTCWFWAGNGQYYYEMAPTPDSRVALATDPKYRDKVFGQPQTHITWTLDPRDQATYRASTALFKTAVNGLGGERRLRLRLERGSTSAAGGQRPSHRHHPDVGSARRTAWSTPI
jgi:hypothetical protein